MQCFEILCVCSRRDSATAQNAEVTYAGISTRLTKGTERLGPLISVNVATVAVTPGVGIRASAWCERDDRLACGALPEIIHTLQRDALAAGTFTRDSIRHCAAASGRRRSILVFRTSWQQTQDQQRCGSPVSTGDGPASRCETRVERCAECTPVLFVTCSCVRRPLQDLRRRANIVVPLGQ
jgi:hypothetical protein